MKKLLLMMTAVVLMTACQKEKPTTCHIVGTVNGEQYEGKRIFLVPLYGPKTAEYVDSIEIKDGKFEFRTDSTKMFKLLMDYHYRFGLQQLLIVGEPGELRVTIDSISHASGTPQNDLLEEWKVRTEQHNMQLGQMRRMVADLERQGDKTQAEYLKHRADSFHLAYKQFSREQAKKAEGKTLGDFLSQMFPLTYKKKMPDGTIKTFDADTNEEVK